MIASRAWNGMLAIFGVIQIVIMATDWYAGKSADWFVWSAAIYGCATITLLCVRDAIRGEW